MEQRLQRLERQKKDDYVFTNNGVAKQAKFITRVEDWVRDELQAKLEAEYGQLPKSLKDVISAGEKLRKVSLVKNCGPLWMGGSDGVYRGRISQE